MPRSYDMAATYGCSVAQVLDAFADKDYWQERLEKSGCDAVSLDTLNTGDDGGVEVITSQTVRLHRLPGLVKQLHSGDLTLVREETWRPLSDGRSDGRIKGLVPGAPVTVSATATLTNPEDARLDVHTTIEVRIPLLGGKVEDFIGGQLAEMIRLEQKFTSAWIRDHR